MQFDDATKSRVKILVTFKMDPCISRVDPTLSICFEDNKLLDHHVAITAMDIVRSFICFFNGRNH